MKVLGIIPARGGSKGLRDKNIRSLLGKPVIYYTIKHALNSEVIDKVVVSTEDAKIAKIVEGYGVQVIKRPKDLATDNAPIELSLRHAVRYLEHNGYLADLIVLLYANVPVRDKGIIEKAVNYLIETKADSVLSFKNVGKFHPEWMFRLDKEKRAIPFMRSNIFRRQDLSPLYIHDGAVTVIRKDVLMQTEGKSGLYSFMGEDIRGIIQDGYTVDIDSLLDFELAKVLLNNRNLMVDD
ncbi:MAG: acylneuraminate cytidylyltransferase family protein [bacterium]|nr:acylneuraminate cytidylyltransferase family protein [bacterium]